MLDIDESKCQEKYFTPTYAIKIDISFKNKITISNLIII